MTRAERREIHRQSVLMVAAMLGKGVIINPIYTRRQQSMQKTTPRRLLSVLVWFWPNKPGQGYARRRVSATRTEGKKCHFASFAGMPKAIRRALIAPAR